MKLRLATWKIKSFLILTAGILIFCSLPPLTLDFGEMTVGVGANQSAEVDNVDISARPTPFMPTPAGNSENNPMEPQT
jgi:hypothetical protein